MKKISTIVFALLAVALFATNASAQDLLTYNLRVGMKGDAQVAILQNFLASGGYLAQGNATGNFGPMTLKAVKAFQSESSVDVTGFVGPKTRGIINNLIGGNAAVVVAPVSVSSITGTSANLNSSYQLPATSAYNTVWFEYATSKDAFAAGTQSKLGQITLKGASSSFTTTITSLFPNVTYYARAVVQSENNSLTVSPVISFTTGTTADGSGTIGTITGTYQNQATAMAGQAYVGANPALSVSDTSVVFSGVFDGRGSATNVWFQYWAGSSAITNTAQQALGSGAGSSSYIASGLNPNTYYSYRMVASTSSGMTYSSVINFTTSASQVSSNGTQYIYVYNNNNGGTSTSGTSTTGTTGGSTTGTTSGTGGTTGTGTGGTTTSGTTTGGATGGTGTGGTSIPVYNGNNNIIVNPNLMSGTTGTAGGTTTGGTSIPVYTGNAAAVINYAHVAMGPAMPTVTTDAVTNITKTSAVLHGTVTNPLGHSLSLVFFDQQYGTANYASTPTTSGSVSFQMGLTGLTCHTNYSYKAGAVDGNNVIWGGIVVFTTLGC